MNGSTRAPLYDLFKSIVAITLLFIYLWLWIRPAQARRPESPLATFTAQLPVPTQASTSTSTPPTEAPTPTVTSTPVPTETRPPTLAPTIMPSPTVPPVAEPLPTPIVEIPEEPKVCEAISHSQLQVGMQAMILRPLNFRSSPGISNNWILTNAPGTQVDIIGGPECKRYQYGGAYLWWQIKLPNDRVGWSAEASAFGAFYFMEPVK